jgi:hypothetical protein
MILIHGPERSAAGAVIMLALGFAALAAWLFRITLRKTPPAAVAPPVLPLLPPHGEHAAPWRPERRRDPRRVVDLAVEIEWHRGGRHPSRLKDISRGGARALHAQGVPAGRRGLLHVSDFNLPVPFTVVEWRQETGLHLRFDLEGMGLDAVEKQLDVLVSRD